jgi:putative spermidine/putrescine transport system permease protein
VRRRPGLLLAPALLLTALVVGASTSVLLLQSLGLMPLVGQPRLSLDAYRAVGPDLLASAGLSLALAAVATTLAAVLGLTTALLVASTQRGSRILRLVAAATVPVPHLVGAAAIGLLLADSGVLPRLLGLSPAQWPDLVAGPWWVAVVAEYVWKESAFIALVVFAVVASRLTSYEQTAAVLGASRRYRLLHVTIPLALPALVVSGAIGFVYVVGSYEVAWLLGRTSPEPLPVLAYRLFSSPDLTARPESAAVAVVTLAVAGAAAAVAVLSLRRSRVAA